MRILGIVSFLSISMLGTALGDPNTTSDFATEVVSYAEGTGVGWDPIDGSVRFNNPNCALGRPTIDTTGDGWDIPLGNPVPVVPPYGAFRAFEVVTIGNGGQLTVKFDHPVLNDPLNPYGLDFILFGNARQNAMDPWINGDPTAYTVAGKVFYEPGIVSVSQDGQTWYTFINGPYADDFAPTLGRVYDPNNPDPNIGSWNQWWGGPTDPTRPLAPTLTAAGFSGQTVAQIAGAYDGSAGGTGFDISLLGLDWIQYVRVQDNPNSTVWTTEVDAIADVARGCLLTVTESHDSWGQVTYEPGSVVPNLPVFFAGTQVRLTATPIEGKAFDHWEIYDPNHPGDVNYLAFDTNNPLTIVMDADREVNAAFKCGSGTGPFLPLSMAMVLMGICVTRGRLLPRPRHSCPLLSEPRRSRRAAK